MVGPREEIKTPVPYKGALQPIPNTCTNLPPDLVVPPIQEFPPHKCPRGFYRLRPCPRVYSAVRRAGMVCSAPLLPFPPEDLVLHTRGNE